MPDMPDETARLPDPPLLWEQHCCLPLSATTDLGELARYQRPGGSYVSVNAGYAPHSTADVLGLLAAFRYGAAADDRYVLVASVADVEQAHGLDQVAVSFDLEDSGPLEGDLGRVQQFYDLGVRTLLPTYNRQNAAGCGCLDAADTGLTGYGRALVREMNAVGMVADGSHCSVRTGLDLCQVSGAGHLQPLVHAGLVGASAQHHRRASPGLRAVRRRYRYHRRGHLPRP
jgi:membrane dipeptidase